jgi:hypothetical protein
MARLMENISTIQVTRIKRGIGRREESADEMKKRSTGRNMDTARRRKVTGLSVRRVETMGKRGFEGSRPSPSGLWAVGLPS